jgi:Fur family ferric uptake transcriptional regulator
MTAPADIVVALDRAGYRLTEPRRALATLIADQHGHFTAADLVSESRARRLGVGRATVFRTIEALEGIGIVERIDLPNGEHAYVACEPVHHHHVVCSRCGRTSEIEDAGLRIVVRDVARRTGFRIDDHRLELFGLCPACQAARPGPTSIPA